MRIVVGMLAVTSVLPGVGPTSHDPHPPRLTIENATPAQVATVDTAAQRFAAANLTLPDLTVRFSDDAADCFGHLGTFDASTPTWSIMVCSDLAFVPTHELAHAWLDSNVDANTRHQYLRARHQDNWDDKRADWSDRGVEDAAFVLQQNLMMSPRSALSEEWQSRSRRIRAAHRPPNAAPVVNAARAPPMPGGPHNRRGRSTKSHRRQDRANRERRTTTRRYR